MVVEAVVAEEVVFEEVEEQEAEGREEAEVALEEGEDSVGDEEEEVVASGVAEHTRSSDGLVNERCSPFHVTDTDSSTNRRNIQGRRCGDLREICTCILFACTESAVRGMPLPVLCTAGTF